MGCRRLRGLGEAVAGGHVFAGEDVGDVRFRRALAAERRRDVSVEGGAVPGDGSSVDGDVGSEVVAGAVPVASGGLEAGKVSPAVYIGRSTLTARSTKKSVPSAEVCSPHGGGMKRPIRMPAAQWLRDLSLEEEALSYR